jgi:hypothetical protein
MIEPISRSNYKFIPLVRKSLELACELNIIFLRKENPGALIHGGDLDNRIKTFFDGLKIPDDPDAGNMPEANDPEAFFCLVEDDNLISGFSIQTDCLLTAMPSANDVRLIVEATIRVMRITSKNIGLLGD